LIHISVNRLQERSLDMKKKKTVLVIDDETDLCALIKLAFMRENFLVDCASNLAEAGKMLHAHPDIIFLDNNLPDGLGIEYFHNHPDSFDDSYIIMMTADMNSRSRALAKEEGIDEFIQKPFSMKTMKDIIQKVA
jgi:two-component system, OmpR family, response regulator